MIERRSMPSVTARLLRRLMPPVISFALLLPWLAFGAPATISASPPPTGAATAPDFELPALGALEGRVLGTDGQAVAGAQVLLQSAGATRSVETGAGGEYHLDANPGLYTMTVRGEGYAKPTMIAVSVSAGQISAVDPTLGCSNAPVVTRITTDTVWNACQIYVINRSINVEGAKLTIQPGAIVKFASYYKIDVISGGHLEVAGSERAPVILTSLKDDSIGGDSNNDSSTSAPATGNWWGIGVKARSTANLAHAVIRYAETALDNFGETTLSQSDFESNAVVRSAGVLNVVGGRFSDPSGSLLENTGSLSVTGSSFRCASICINDNGTAGFTVVGSSFEGTGTGSAIGVRVSRTIWNGRIEANWFRSLSNSIKMDFDQAGIAPAARISGNRFERVTKAAAILSGTLGRESTLPFSDRAYVVDSSLKILPGASLRVEPGTVVKFWGGRLDVNGSLVAEGSPGHEIIFTSHRDDTVGGDSNGDGGVTVPAPGDWNGVSIALGGSATLDHTTWHYASSYSAAFDNAGHLSIRNSTITDARSSVVLNRDHGTLDMANTTVNRFVEYGVSGPGSSRVVNSHFTWITGSTGIAGGADLTVLNSTFEGIGRGEGVRVNVDHAAWNGALAGNTFRNMERAATITMTEGGIGPSATLTGNRSERVARGTVVLSGSMNIDTVLPVSSLPYGWGGLRVREGRTLRVPPGSVFKSKSTLWVDGHLLAEGLPNRRITFTSLRDDSVTGDSNGDGDATRPARGDVTPIYIESSATATIRYADFRYGEASASLLHNRGQTEVTESSFSHSYYGIWTWVPSLTVHFSRFEDTTYGVYAVPETGVDARYNYWGADDGPRPCGGGDAVNYHVERGGGDCHPVYSYWRVRNPHVAPWLTHDYFTEQQLGPVPWADHVNGVNTATGNYSLTATDARVEGGKGAPVVIQRTYNSLDPSEGPFGRGWTFNYDFRLADEGRAVHVRFPTGRGARFLLKADGTYEQDASIYDHLVREADGSYTLTDRAHVVYRFSAAGQLLTMTDPNGNTVTLGYDGGKLTSVTDAAGRRFVLAWDGTRISRIADPAGQAWTYAYDTAKRLTTVTDPSRGVTTYEYSKEGRMTAIRRKVDATRDLLLVRMEHDAKGRVTAQFDADENKTQFIYDDAGRTTTVVDPTGARTVRTFDHLMRQVLLTDPLGNTEAYGFDGDNSLVEYRDKNGQTTQYTYDDRGNKLSETLPATPEGTATTTWQYHRDFNLPTTITDPLGGVIQNVYDDRGNLKSTTDKRKQTTHYESYPNGLLQSLRDPLGNVTTFEYDDHGNLRLQRAPDPFRYETRYEHDGLGRVTKVTDPLKNVTATTYQPTGELVTRTDPDGTTANLFDLAGRVIATTDPRRTTIYLYNTRGLLEREVRQVAVGVNAETAYTYDKAGRQESITDPMGNRTINEYDAAGRLKAVKVRASGSTVEELRAQYEYDGAGRMTASKDGNENRTEFRYDALGQLRERLDPGATSPATFTYDLLGRKVSERDATGVTVTYEFDAAGSLLKVRDGRNQVTAHEYDNVGNRTATTDPRHQTTTYGYDQLNRLQQVTDPYHKTMEFGYDALGNQTSVKDPDRNITSFTYDPKGRLKSVTEPGTVLATTAYEYDAAGNLLKVTDALKRVREYRYDLGNRLMTEIDPARASVEHAYDLAGNRLTTQDKKGGLTRYTYDYLYRMTGISAPGGIETRFTYDANGNRTAMKDGTGTTAYVYDGMNRLRSQRMPDGKEIAYQYDGAGRVTATTGYDGAIINRAYQPLTGRLDNVNGPDGLAVQFAYDDAGNRTSIRYGNGVTGAYSYDNLNRVESVEWKDGAGGLLAAAGYQYDPRGNVKERTDGRGRTVYGYDERNRLVRVAAPEATYQYAYDKVGNREALTVTSGTAVERTAYQYDSLDRLVKQTEPDGSVRTSLWDANGNQLSDGRNQYVYDGLNRLVAVILPDGKRIEYRNDGDGLLVARQAAGSTTQYYYDGSHPYLEVEGGSTARNLVVGGLPVARQSAAGTVWYLTDGHRDVVGLADRSGKEVGSYAYDAFGNPVVESGSVRNPFRYAGEQWDEQAGLYYLRARHYAPGVGRFLTKDSYGGHADQPWTMHGYMYAGNNPVNWTDPSGHCVAHMDWFCGSVGKALVNGYAVVAEAARNGALNPSFLVDTGYDGGSGHEGEDKICREVTGLSCSDTLLATGIGLSANPIIGPVASEAVSTDEVMIAAGAEDATAVARAEEVTVAMANGSKTTRLWRAVGPEELADIHKYGDYNIFANSTAKRFFASEAEVARFMQKNPNYQLTKTYVDVPTDYFKNNMFQHNDFGIGTAYGIDVYYNPEFYNQFDRVHIVP